MLGGAWPPSSVLRFARALHTASIGLFSKKELQQPKDWVTYAQNTVNRCQPIVSEAITSPPSASIIQLLDDISDHLCQVYDAAEFCRNVHTDSAWRQQALQAVLITSRYIQELNMHHGLYSAVVQSLEHYDRLQSHAQAAASGKPQTSSSRAAEVAGYDEETVLVGRALQKDFEQRGVHLNDQDQRQALQLTQEIATLGMNITAAVSDPGQLGCTAIPGHIAADWANDVPEAWREHMDDRVRKSRQSGSPKAKPFRGTWGSSGGQGSKTVPLDQGSVSGILQWVSDEEVRQKVWQASRQTPEQNKQAIVEFCWLRKDFAQLLGFESHAHLQAGLASLAGTPQAVLSFFDQAHAASRPKAADEYEQLRAKKRAVTGIRSSTPQHWDRPYLTRLIRAEQGMSTSALGQYLSLSNCLEGLCAIVLQLTGVSLQKEPLQPGESWAAGVQKMVALDESGTLLGHVYLDLFPRQGKFAHAAHFTLRCGRQPSSGPYQTPMVALACNFEQSAAGALSYLSASTLFHEFGHALHSLLSRTRYQHLSGTRGAMDVIEIPSHFMENYVSDPRTVRMFARHNSSGALVPEGLVQQTVQDSQLLGALDLESQICHSMMDQLFHSSSPPASQAAAADAMCELWSKYSSFPSDCNINPHLRFAHLVNYGGSYYSYAYAMCLASSIWKSHFQADPLSRKSGDVLRFDLLQHGGAKEPAELVRALLGENLLQEIGGGFAPHTDGLLRHYGILSTA